MSCIIRKSITSGIYLLCPYQSSIGQPQISVSNGKLEVTKLISNPEESLLPEWKSKHNELYDSLYLIRIYDTAPDKSIRLAIKMNNEKIWNSKQRIILDVPPERIIGGGGARFLFKMTYKSPKTNTLFPEDTKIITLSEEVAYLQSYFLQKNEWVMPGIQHFLEDLLIYIAESILENEKIEFDVILFIIKRSLQNKLAYFLSFKVDLKRIELPQTIIINEVDDFDFVIATFNKALRDKRYEVEANTPEPQKSITNEENRNLIIAYFVVFLLKYDQKQLIQYTEKYNTQPKKNSKKFINIITDPNYFPIFNDIGISNENLVMLGKFCQTEDDLKGLLKFVTNLDLLLKVFSNESNINGIKAIDNHLKHKIILNYKENLNSEKDIQMYTEKMTTFLKMKYKNVQLDDRQLKEILSKFGNDLQRLEFISKNVLLFDKQEFKFENKPENALYLREQTLDEFKQFLQIVNTIYEYKQKGQILKIIIDLDLLKEKVNANLLGLNVEEIVSFTKDFKTNYYSIYSQFDNILVESLRQKLIKIIEEGSATNEKLLNLLLHEKEEKVNYSEYTIRFCKLISFENISDSYAKSFQEVVVRFFSSGNNTLSNFYKELITNIKSFEEMINFLEINKPISLNITIIKHVFMSLKQKFCNLVETIQNKNVKLISECFKKIFFYFKDANAEDDEKIMKEFLHKIEGNLNRKETENILYDMFKSKATTSDKLKKTVINYLFSENISPEENIQIVLKHQDCPELIKAFFKKKEDLVLKEEDFFEQTQKFDFFTKLLINNVFEFKNNFQALKSESFFNSTKNVLKKIINSLDKKQFTLNSVNSMNEMINKNTFDQNLKYLHLNAAPPAKFISELKVTITQFVDYDKALSNVHVFINYFYGPKNNSMNKINQLKDSMKSKKIDDLIKKNKEDLEFIKLQNIEAEQYVKIIGSKFFDVIYQQNTGHTDKERRKQAKTNFEKLKYLLDINNYTKVPSEILNNIVYFCNEEIIINEFKFLEAFFVNEKKNNPEEVKRRIIIGANKGVLLRFIESTLLLCKEYEVQETEYTKNYKVILDQLQDTEISIDQIQNIEKELCKGVLNIQEKKENYYQILTHIHQKENFFAFIKNKTKESIENLNEDLDIIDDQTLSPGDFPKFEEVFDFCFELRKHKGKTDQEFLKEFKNNASNKDIATSFKIVIPKFLSFKDLYNRRANKEEFAHEKIKEILNYSIVNIFYNEETLNIEITIKYSINNRSITLKELLELKEKSQLKNNVNQNQNDKDEELIKNIMLFTNVTQQIVELLDIENSLVQKGDPELHAYLIKIEKKQISLTTDSDKNDNLGEIIQKRQDRLKQLIKSQENMYKKEGNVILTFLFGKNIYQLQRFLKSKGLQGLNQIEPLFKYLTKNKYQRQYSQDLCKTFNYISGENPTNFMEDCAGMFLKKLLKKCGVVSDNIFDEVLIKNEKNINPGIYTSLLDPVQLFQENLMKVYLRYTGHFPIPQALLFCNGNTTLEEVTAFLYRALYYPKKVLFGIVQTEFLPIAVREGILSILEQEELLSNEPISKRMKSVFVLFYTDLRLNIRNEMYQKKMETIFNKLEKEEVDVKKDINNIKIVYSNGSGVGKSYIIKKESEMNHKKYEYFPIGGDFVREDIIRRLQTYQFESGKSLIHLDIHETKKVDLIKDFLFSFLILRSYFFNDLLFYLESDVEIVIEIPFGFIDYFKQLPLLNLIKNVIFIDRKKLPEYEVSQDLVSDDQIVCSVLKIFQKKEISEKAVQHSKLDRYPMDGTRCKKFKLYLIGEQALTQKECNTILQNALNIDNPTFYQKKIFISILANQFKSFLQSIYLNPNLLYDNGKRKKNSNLYKIREIIIDFFIKLTTHFTKGAYDGLLQKTNIAFKSHGLEYDNNKAEEAAVKELSKKKQVSFKDIDPSLLLFNKDGQSLSVVTTIKPKTATKEKLQEYNNFKALINSNYITYKK